MATPAPRRSRQAERYRYAAITPREFAERIGATEQHVREMIGAGWFRAEGEGGLPECLNVAKPAAKRPTYRIHESAVRRFYRERAS